MFMNRWQTWAEIVEANALTPVEAAKVLAKIRPIEGDRFLEADADSVIGEVRRCLTDTSETPVTSPKNAGIRVSGFHGRPRGAAGVFIDGNNKMNTKENSVVTWAETVGHNDPDENPQSPVDPLLVDERSAATMLGVSRRTVFQLNKQGRLPSRQIGKRKLYAVRDIETFAHGGNA